MKNEFMRSSGVLLHISSLPSPYGIGTLGKSAYEFADFLADAGQTYWQMLPLSKTGVGDSPYSSVSAFAGNPYFIDIDMLIDWGLISRSEADAFDFGENAKYVDYEKLAKNRYSLLMKAAVRTAGRFGDELAEFCKAKAAWLEDYAIYSAAKKHFGGLMWSKWPDEGLKHHEERAIKHYKDLLEGDIERYKAVQFLFYKQLGLLREYLTGKNIKAIGDIPIYVSYDSADVWSHSELFMLSPDLAPVCVAGVPPDYFSETGQLWGNPIYDWEKHAKTGFSWWKERISSVGSFFDVIRIDHFRGFDEYWAVKYGEATAVHGTWQKGPGKAIVDAFSEIDCKIIAEDLGVMSDGVTKLLEYSGYPGMRVLEFGFDADGDVPHLPHMYVKNCVAYTGTHDNDTVQGWIDKASDTSLARAEIYLGLNEKEGYVNGFIRGIMMSPAVIAIVPMQDILGLGGDCRMNMPSTVGENWKWRLTDNTYGNIAESYAKTTARYGRSRK